MDELATRIIDLLGSDGPFLCSLATLTPDGLPWVRFVRATIGDDLTLRCPTFAATKKVEHIRTHPEVHLCCGHTNPATPGSYLQIEGRASISCRREDRELAWHERLERWFTGIEDPNYAVVCVKPHRITVLPIGRSGDIAVWSSPPRS